MTAPELAQDGPRDPLHLGIVGCGPWARDAYLPTLVDCAEVAVTALCDRDESRAAALADSFAEQGGTPRATVHTDYRRMFEHEIMDLVIVSTLAHVRPEITIAALEAGVHVMAAKPMALSLAEGERMLEAAVAAGRILLVGYNYRFRDDARVVHQFIGDGGIGEPRYARAWVHAPGVPSYAPHYVNSLSGGGALASTGIHPLDLAVWFMGCPPLLSAEGQADSRLADLGPLPPDLEAIRDEYETDDLVSGYVRFADGLALTTESSWMAPEAVQGNGVEVWGTKGYASIGPLRLLSWGDGDYVDRTEEVAPGLASSFRDTDVRQRRELVHFIDCVLGRDQPLIVPREMWTVQAILEGLYGGRREYDPANVPDFAQA